MRNTAKAIIVTSAALVAASIFSVASAQGKAPSPDACKDENALKSADAATQGGCVVIDRRKGNCMACHQIAGIASGDIAPPLVAMQQRFPDKSKLRAQINNASQFNPNSVMPPFGPHKILSQEEIDKVVEFVLTL